MALDRYGPTWSLLIFETLVLITPPFASPLYIYPSSPGIDVSGTRLSSIPLIASARSISRRFFPASWVDKPGGPSPNLSIACLRSGFTFHVPSYSGERPAAMISSPQRRRALGRLMAGQGGQRFVCLSSEVHAWTVTLLGFDCMSFGEKAV